MEYIDALHRPFGLLLRSSVSSCIESYLCFSVQRWVLVLRITKIIKVLLAEGPYDASSSGHAYHGFVRLPSGSRQVLIWAVMTSGPRHHVPNFWNMFIHFVILTNKGNRCFFVVWRIPSSWSGARDDYSVPIILVVFGNAVWLRLTTRFQTNTTGNSSTELGFHIFNLADVTAKVGSRRRRPPLGSLLAAVARLRDSTMYEQWEQLVFFVVIGRKWIGTAAETDSKDALPGKDYWIRRTTTTWVTGLIMSTSSLNIAWSR
jgi:hypothetical protein